jgi:ubiquinone/menaquinone biosynthesis C-methylase UbiE
VPAKSKEREGWHGWDAYAPFYDWENARTLGRRDVPFWRQVARAARGPVLELGCGTGRVSIPLAKAGVDLIGIDRSAEMQARLQKRCPPANLRIVRGDIRHLPFRERAFSTVIAPYGLLQSLLRDRDLKSTLDAVARVLPRGGTFGLDLVPDVPNWQEYSNRIQHRGKGARGAHFTLVESVRQDRARRLTTFEQRYVVRRGSRTSRHEFELTFRTLSMRQMSRRLENAGFAVDSVLGDYRGRPWDARADVWIILAKKM